MLLRKVFIPFDPAGKIGGPTTFMGNLKKYLDENNFFYSKKPYFAKGIFFAVAYDLRIIKWIKFWGGRVIQRLDGIYYPSQHGQEYKLLNANIEIIYKTYADLVVFQSEYSRRQCFAMLGEKKPEQFVIIHNGADLQIFHPAKETLQLKANETVKFVMSGSFRKLAMLVPVIKALDQLKDNFDFELQIAGPIHEQALEPWLERDYVKKLGSLDHNSLAETLRQSHVFLHSQLNDNCPNAVIEAISSGLPIVGFDSGAMKELLHFQSELLAEVSTEIFHQYEDFDPNKLAAKIEIAVREYPLYKALALEHWKDYDFEECGRRYVEVLRKK